MTENKYIIEDGIDFFAELYKSLDDKELLEKTEEDNNKCLITNQPLTDKFVELNCGHKFNYVALYYDLANHKLKFNLMETKDCKSYLNQIRCPYCRNKQNTLLPYYKELGLKPINGVNCYIPIIQKYKNNKPEYTNYACEYLIPNKDFDPTIPYSVINSKLIKCGLSITNNVMSYMFPGNEDTCLYCYSHLNIKTQQYNDKIKEENIKIKAQKKIITKELIKLNKNSTIKETNLDKNITIENVILGPSIITTGCIQHLKTGPNKGNICNCKIFMENKCKRHYSKAIDK